MRNKKFKQPFLKGGVVALPMIMLKSNAYISLSAQAKTLMVLMQQHWRYDRPIGYGIREACKLLPCSKGKAQKVFKELEAGGFIVKIDESLFNSRIGSKTRTWRLTWMPYQNKRPTTEFLNEK